MISPQDIKDERKKNNNIGLINDYLPISKSFLLQYCRITICANAAVTVTVARVATLSQ